MAFINKRKLTRMREQMGPAACVRHLRKALQEGQLAVTDFSLRGLAEGLIPDGREFVDLLNPQGQGDPDVPGLLEAVDSAAFKTISGQLIYTAILEAYQNPMFIGDQVTTTIPTQFNGEKIPGVTGLGDEAEVVDEGQPYPRAGVGEDWVDTPQTTKRGFLVEVTKEAVFFDRTNLVLDRCKKVGDSLGINREKRILDLVLGVTNNYKWRDNAHDTYQASTPWINVNASNGLSDWTNIDDSLLMFSQLTDPHTAEPITVVPTQLLCHRAKVATARYILNNTEVRVDPNANAGTQQYMVLVPNHQLIQGSYSILNSPWVDARYTAASLANTTWFFGDYKRAFAYMENWPITTVEMPANSYVEWERDIVAGWKASERGTVAVRDPRYVQKNTA